MKWYKKYVIYAGFLLLLILNHLYMSENPQIFNLDEASNFFVHTVLLFFALVIVGAVLTPVIGVIQSIYEGIEDKKLQKLFNTNKNDSNNKDIHSKQTETKGDKKKSSVKTTKD